MTASPVRNGLWNALAAATVIVSGVISSVIVVRQLDVAAYGTYSFYSWLAVSLSAVGTLAFPDAINKFIAELRGRDASAQGWALLRWTTAVLIVTNLSLTALVIVWNLLRGSVDHGYLAVIAFVPVLNVLGSVTSATLAGYERYRPGALVNAISGVAQLVVVVAATAFHWGIAGYLVAVLAQNLAITAGLVVAFMKSFPKRERPPAERLEAGVRRRYLSFVLPATLYHTVFNAMLWHRPEVLLLERSGGLTEVAFYNLAFSIFSLFLVLGWALVNAYYPAISRAFAAGAGGDVRHKVVQGVVLSAVFSAPVTFGVLAAGAPLVTIIYGEKMAAAAPVLQVLALALFPGVATGFFSLVMNAMNQPWALVRFSLVAALIKAALMAAVIAVRGGAIEAAWSNVVASTALLAIMIVWMRRAAGVGFPVLPVARVLASAFAGAFGVAVAARALVAGSAGVAFAVTGAVIAYPALAWASRALTPLLTAGPAGGLRIAHLLGDRRLTADPTADGAGGVVRVALELARVQARAGHEVYVVAVGRDAWTASWEGVRLVRLRAASWARFRLGRRSFDFRIHLPYAIFTLLHDLDVAHGHTDNYMRFVHARARVAHFHGDPFYEGFGQSTAYSRGDFGHILRHTQAQVAVSRFVAGQLERGFRGRGHVRAVYNGVDHAAFCDDDAARAAFRGKLGVRDDDVLFLYAGALSVEKGVLHLARAFAALTATHPAAHLVIAGGTALWSLSINDPYVAYEREVLDVLRRVPHPERVHLLGVRAMRDMPEVFAACDAAVVPSVWQEGFGLVALEAFACGRPVIVSRSGALPELVNASNGVIVPAGDEAALTAAMARLTGDAALRARLGAAATVSARGFTWQRTAAEIHSVYSSVLNRGDAYASTVAVVD